jgi:hypothetical protein
MRVVVKLSVAFKKLLRRHHSWYSHTTWEYHAYRLRAFRQRSEIAHSITVADTSIRS